MDKWQETLDLFMKAIEKVGGDVTGYKFYAPVDLLVVREIEENLGMTLPKSFVKVVTEYASGMDMNWELPDRKHEYDEPIPQALRSIFAGSFNWSLKNLIEVENGRRGWEKEVFRDENDAYDKVWHNKLAFVDIENGDYLAFDLSIPDDPPVIYLSHDDGEGHGYRLGDNFIDFMDKWIRVGCVGCEEWQLTPFMDSSTSGINPDSVNAQLWCKWLDVRI
jgi:hypothetical protein